MATLSIEKNRTYSISRIGKNKIYRDCVCTDIDGKTYTFKAKTGQVLIIDRLELYSIW